MKQRHTAKHNKGYRFYVYISPGNISYFRLYENARDYADKNGVNTVGVVM